MTSAIDGLRIQAARLQPIADATPVPEPFNAEVGLAPVPNGRIWYRDTGGSGPVLVLLHPATGSALIWDHQFHAFSRAGYRVIAYSRRGHFGSDPAVAEPISDPVLDLAALLDHLRVERCALVGAAAGCSVALDFALSQSGRLQCAIFSCGSFSGIRDPGYKAMSRRVLVDGFETMPPHFRELGPSYRASNPAGVAAWLALERKAVCGERSGVRSLNVASWDSLARIKAPTLFLAGGADLYAPPPQVREVAVHVPGACMAVLPESGHSPHWEMPQLFNGLVLRYLATHLPR